MLRRCSTRVQVLELEQLRRRLVADDLGADAQVGVDVEKLTGFEVAPGGVLVHALGGDDDSLRVSEVVRANADPAGLAGALEMAASVRAAGGALEYEQVVRVRIAKSPEPVRRREHDVERLQR